MNTRGHFPSLGRIWTSLLLTGALALGALAVWHGNKMLREQQQVEQVAVLREIGRSIAAQLEYAQQLGIPLQDTVGLDAWLASQNSASPLLSGLAITLASGDLLAQRGMPSAVLLASRQSTGDSGTEAGQAWVRIAVTPGTDGTPAAWLHACGTAQAWMRTEMGATLALALLAGLLAAWGMRRWLRHHVDQPLGRIQAHLTLLASGHAVGGSVAAPCQDAHELGRLDRALALRWTQQQQRNAALLQKLNEVRAAHFDTAVLSRIDSLAGSLLNAPPALRGHAPAATRPRWGWPSWSLNRRFSVGLVAVWLLTLAGLWALQALHADQQARTQAAAHTQWLQMAFDQALARSLGPLEPMVGQPMAQAVSDNGLEAARAALPPSAQWWMAGSQGQPLGLGGADSGAPVPPRQQLLDDLALQAHRVHGLWVGSDHTLWAGLAQAVTLADGTTATLVAAQPVAEVIQHLARSLGTAVTLADHRGQPLARERSALIERWQQHNRKPVPPDGTQANWLLSVPLLSYSNHTLGHLVALVPQDSAMADPMQRGTQVLLMGVFGLGLGALLWAVGRQLRPLSEVAHKVAHLAQSESAATEASAPEDIRMEAIHQDIGRVENRLDVLRALKRSRERQGRRQARFIRHQMMELANRLDDAARTDVLKDLEKIEAASGSAPSPAKAAADPRFERMVDEVGVLALGFQNLVGRVSDQYQQLGHMVQELREALRVKTQFIAIQQELEIARKMQMTFLPHDFSNQAGVELHGVTHPAREVGGDFYDFFRIDEHHLAVLVADVSGKGVPAAFFMAVSRTLMRAVAQFTTSPSECLQRLNDLLADNNEEMMFVTLFYAVIDTRSGEVQYGNAGHNPPYVVRSQGGVEMIPSTGDMALAVMPDMPYRQKSLQLAPGDALFLFTDGVTEAASPEGAWFGEARLETLLAETGRDESMKNINLKVINAVSGFEAGGAQSDDVTCLMVRLTT